MTGATTGAVGGEAAGPTALCRLCKLDLEPGAEVCPHCGQWQKPRRRTAEQWLGLFGGAVGLASTSILLFPPAWNRLVKDEKRLVAIGAVCREDGIIVQLENQGWGNASAPRSAGEVMSTSKEQRTKLVLATSIKIAPGDQIEADYRPDPADARLQQDSTPSCRREITIGADVSTSCSCVFA